MASAKRVKTMTSRVADMPEVETACQDPRHFATARKRRPGTYLHTCPRCGFEQRFRVEEKG